MSKKIQTLEKYINIAEEMRKNKNYQLDISKYEPKEVMVITTLVQDDEIFEALSVVKDVELKKLKATHEIIKAQNKITEANKVLDETN